MRARDPHDDPPAKLRPEPYRGPPVTLGHMIARQDDQPSRPEAIRRLLGQALGPPKAGKTTFSID
jgi:hypothetical protein